MRGWASRASMRSLALAACGWCVAGCAAVQQSPPPAPAPSHRSAAVRPADLDVLRMASAQAPAPGGSVPAWPSVGLRTPAAPPTREAPPAVAAPGPAGRAAGEAGPVVPSGYGRPTGGLAADETGPGLADFVKCPPSGEAQVAPPGAPGQKYLLPLLMEEQRLLAEYGPEHPSVCSVRGRIAAVQDYLEQHPGPPETERKPTPAPPPVPPPVAAPIPRGGDTKVEFFPVTLVLPAGPERRGAGEDREKGARPARRGDEKATPAAAEALSHPAPHAGAPTAAGPDAARPERLAPAAVPAAAPPGSGAASLAGRLAGLSRWQRLGAGLCLVGLLAHLLALLSFLRWYRRRIARRVRARLTAGRPGQSVEGPAPVESAPATEAGPRVTAEATVEVVGGPPQQTGQEESLLRQVFEDNLWLRGQLEQLPT